MSRTTTQMSVYYAALRSAKRYTDAEKIVDAHQHGVRAALSYLNREAVWAATPAPGSWQTGA